MNKETEIVIIIAAYQHLAIEQKCGFNADGKEFFQIICCMEATTLM